MADDQYYWRIEVEIEIDFDGDTYEFTIEELGLLDADFDEWLESVQYKDDELGEEDGDDD